MNAPRRAACAAIMLYAALGATIAIAADSTDICTRASLTNPAANETGAGGMGGTGIVVDVKPVVPGTGGMGGTGIVGVITGFASICVNGVEVHYDARTPVSVNGRAGAARDLAVGHVVVVQARMADGQMQASGIGLINAVSGPVTRVDTTTREVQVMGQTIRADSAIGTDLSSLRVGAQAQVSGHRAENGDIIATRIDTGTSAGTSLLGRVTRVEADALIVNGTRVNMGGRGTQGISAGSEVFASGEWSGAALQARRVDTQPVRNAIARNERAILEGYVRSKTLQQLDVGGLIVRLGDQVRYSGGNDRDADVGRKVQVEVRRSGNEWQAERVNVQRDDRQIRPGRDGRTQGGGSEGGDNSRSENRSDSSGSSNSGSGNSGSSGSSGSSGRSSGSGSGSGSRPDSGSGSSRSGRR